jgi:hypothetical protein
MRDFDEAAIGFKNSVINSMNSARLDADLAVKALPGAKDSDGKKRTNTGEIPGVVDVNGVRFKPGEKGGENKTFLWLPSLQSKINESRKDVNFGWVEKATDDYISFTVHAVHSDGHATVRYGLIGGRCIGLPLEIAPFQ